MKLGLKLWSRNTDFYFEEAKRLFKGGWFNYIELYVVPNTVDTIEKWKTLGADFNIPFTLHAPHFINGVNLAEKSKEEFNYKIFEEVGQFCDELNAGYIVVHSGIEGDIEETIRQLKIINLKKMLIENKPYIAPLKKDLICRGATIEEISKVIDGVGCGFCLDIGHAICTYNSLLKSKDSIHHSPFNIHSEDPYGFLKQFNALKPRCYHLSDNFIDNHIDSHLHLGQGNFDFKKIFDIINTDKNIAIETNKNSKENLDDFIKDVQFLKNFEE